MIAETLMHFAGWSDIWYAHPRTLWNALKWGGRWHVGIWTGPQHDLICTRRCKTNEEAEKYLSPGGRTILSAVLKAIWKDWWAG